MATTIWGNVPYAPSGYEKNTSGEMETFINEYTDGS